MLTKWARFRLRRSSFQTTSTSSFRSARRQLQGREPQDLPVDLQGRLLGESAEHTHEGDLVRETQPVVVGAPPQGDGLEEGGIADQAGAGDVGVGDQHGSVREKRAF